MISKQEYKAQLTQAREDSLALAIEIQKLAAMRSDVTDAKRAFSQEYKSNLYDDIKNHRGEAYLAGVSFDYNALRFKFCGQNTELQDLLTQHRKDCLQLADLGVSTRQRKYEIANLLTEEQFIKYLKT